MGIKYFLFFLYGGAVTSSIIYLTEHSKGTLAAFIGMIPVISLCTFIAIYNNTGAEAVTTYARSLFMMSVPWLLYMAAVTFLTPKLNFPVSMTIAVAVQVVFSMAIVWKMQHAVL
jgi:uncharacterized membrane protein (GlpM family)